MADLTTLQTRLEALRAQVHSPIARVSYDGRTVEYRGQSEIQTAIADLERQIAQVSGTKPVRQIRVHTTKGY
ncbi:phage head-tail joining protein [Magnetococcus sp. PR-3]|uniref:phage head-tail joining protein n=1 Tax=Magnetococcus sp. PR-3 TaxID=3120355 RepID=UPI002FCE0E53